VQEPNALDRRVDTIAPTTLMSQPAAALVDADRQVAAARYVRWHSPGFFASVLLAIAALAYFWRSGSAAVVRDRLRQSVRSEWVVRFCFGALLAAIAKFASLVPAFYLYRVDRVMGLSSELTRTWIVDWLRDLSLAMVIAGAVAAIVLWLADRTHQWYIYTILGIVAACVLLSFANPFVVAPLYNAHAPLRAPLRGQLDALERSAGYDIPIVVEDRSKRTQTDSSALTGLSSSQEIVLSDSLVAGSTPGEDDFYIAHELGHAAHHDSLRLALLNALVIIVGVALAVFVADRIGFRRDDDPVSRLALVGAFLGCAYLLAVPVYDAALRSMERGADAYAVNLLKDPTPAVRAMIRLADERVISICPSPVDMLYFARYPAIAERVSAFNHVHFHCP
jgi:STE24 endopeptidase